MFSPRDFEAQAGSSELIRQLIDIFAEECREALKRIESACEQDDTQALHEAAHALKGMVGNYGARHTLNQAKKIDSFAREGDVARARAELPNLRESLDQLQQALLSFREQLSQDSTETE